MISSELNRECALSFWPMQLLATTRNLSRFAFFTNHLINHVIEIINVSIRVAEVRIKSAPCERIFRAKIAEMPFVHKPRAVAEVHQHLGQRLFRQRESSSFPAPKWSALHPCNKKNQ